MIVRCYAVYDAKTSDFHLCVFDIKDEGGIRQFSDAVNDTATRWNKHPEDYSLWYVGTFDTEHGMIKADIPVNLVNASAILTLTRPKVPMDLFEENGKEKIKEPA